MRSFENIFYVRFWQSHKENPNKKSLGEKIEYNMYVKKVTMINCAIYIKQKPKNGRNLQKCIAEKYFLQILLTNREKETMIKTQYETGSTSERLKIKKQIVQYMACGTGSTNFQARGKWQN